jgi:hypothetical protein
MPFRAEASRKEMREGLGRLETMASFVTYSEFGQEAVVQLLVGTPARSCRSTLEGPLGLGQRGSLLAGRRAGGVCSGARLLVLKGDFR